MPSEVGPQGNARRWRVPMIARDPEQRDRASTPLELFFDLCFVVAVSQAASGLHDKLAAGAVGAGVVDYVLVFFGIWWAWMNFTWFASAYDTDDVPYRLLTLVQIAGALVFAAGVAQGFEDRNFTVVTWGYVVMRVAMVSQWLRAARSHPEGRTTALRYAAGIAICQIGWLLRLLLPGELGLVAYVFLACCELAVPAIAEAGRTTTWNPRHITERYGLFTLIVLGESVAAATLALQRSVTARGVSVDLVALAMGGLVLVFGIWWNYFKHEPEERLRRGARGGRLALALGWGYGHFGIFAAIAALGAGLELALAEHGDVGAPASMTAAFAVAVPTALFLVLGSLVHARLDEDRRYLPTPVTYLAAAVVLAVGLAAMVVALWLVVVGIGLVVGLLAAGQVVSAERFQRRAPRP